MIRRIDPEACFPPEPAPGCGHVGRLCDLPGVRLGPLPVTPAELWQRAPPWLRAQVRPLNPVEEMLWRVLGDPGRLGTCAVAKVPLYLPEIGDGIVVDFLLPDYSFAVEVGDFWCAGDSGEAFDREVAEDTERLEWDEALREFLGIERLHFYADGIVESPERIVEEIRWEVGLQR
ncbi:MAG: hypothetical protein ACE5JG_12480 [Planctomycetota bacterium]